MTLTRQSQNSETCCGWPLAGESDDLLCGVFHSRSGDKSQAGLLDDLTALLNICSFEANDNRNFHADVPCGRDNSGRDHICAHDPAEDVDQYGADVLVREQNPERVLDPLLRSSAADIQKVRGLSAGELDDVHRSHRQTRAVNHATDVTVELDVVQIVL